MTIAACGSSPMQHGDDDDQPDAGISIDGTTTIATGTVLDTTTVNHLFLHTEANGLWQYDDGLFAGTEKRANGQMVRGQLDGNFAVVVQPPNQQVATPPTFCRWDTTTGVLDPTFGTNGCAKAPLAYFGSAGIVKTADGYRAIVQKNCSNGCADAERSFGLVKFSSSGVLDTSFGTDGILFTTIMPQLTALQFVPQSSGDFVVSGYTGLYNMKLFRIHPDGTLDTTFGTAGFATVLSGSRLRVFADDSIMLESTYNGYERIDRFTKDGVSTAGIDLKQLTHAVYDNDYNQTAADVDASGRIVIGYRWTLVDDGPETYYVMRVLANGTLDTSFAPVKFADGVHWIYGIGFEPDGRIIVGASSSSGQLVGHIQP